MLEDVPYRESLSLLWMRLNEEPFFSFYYLIPTFHQLMLNPLRQPNTLLLTALAHALL